MSLNQNQVHWEDMGKLDACWAILTEPGTKHGKWDRAKFFATGEDEIAAFLRVAEGFGLPKHNREALDFGCGVGRLTRALSSRFEHVLGIDISQSMVRLALDSAPPPNCEFLVNIKESLPFASRRFDLVCSTIVLQHVPQKDTIRLYIAEFLRVLNNGGLLVMQLPDHMPLRRRLQLRPRLYAWLRRLGISEHLLYHRLGLHPISMNFIPEEEVIALIEANGGRVVQSLKDQRAGPFISSRTYYVTRTT